MQLMENTAKEVAINEFDEEVTEDSLCDPETNIRLGVKYFADLMEIFQEEAVALAAYNAGMGTVQGWIDEGIIKADGSDIENIPYNETNMYVRKILKDYDIYKRLYRRVNYVNFSYRRSWIHGSHPVVELLNEGEKL